MYIKRNEHCRNLRDVVEANTGIPAGQFIKRSQEPYLKNLKEAVQMVKTSSDGRSYRSRRL